MTQLSICQILDKIPVKSKLAERCRMKPSFRENLIRCADTLSTYYASQSGDAISSFHTHLRHFQYDPENYLSYYTELLFANLLHQKGIDHRFLKENNAPNPDIEVSLDGRLLYCEIASIQEDAILESVMLINERVSRISSGVIISLSIPTLDHARQFEYNLSLINDVGNIIEDSLRRNNYSPIMRDEFEIEFTPICEDIPSEIIFVRATWGKTDWLRQKLAYVFKEKCNQIDSKPDTILVWWNHDPRLMDFRQAIPEVIATFQIPIIAGVLLVDPLLSVVSFPNSNMPSSFKGLAILEEALRRNR